MPGVVSHESPVELQSQSALFEALGQETRFVAVLEIGQALKVFVTEDDGRWTCPFLNHNPLPLVTCLRQGVRKARLRFGRGYGIESLCYVLFLHGLVLINQDKAVK
jgi:hypothetical protein